MGLRTRQSALDVQKHGRAPTIEVNLAGVIPSSDHKLTRALALRSRMFKEPLEASGRHINDGRGVNFG
jgi:hypothetical protein